MGKDIDFEKIMLLVQGSRDLLAKLLDAAKSDWTTQMTLLEEAVKAGDNVEIVKRVHRINGSVRNFYCKSLTAQLTGFEDSARSGRPVDWAAALIFIRTELYSLENSIEQFLENQNP